MKFTAQPSEMNFLVNFFGRKTKKDKNKCPISKIVAISFPFSLRI
jgi:hypothetical protein